MIANLLLQAVDTIDEGDIFIAAFLVKYIIDTLDQWFPNNVFHIQQGASPACLFYREYLDIQNFLRRIIYTCECE